MHTELCYFISTVRSDTILGEDLALTAVAYCTLHYRHSTLVQEEHMAPTQSSTAESQHRAHSTAEPSL
jgi:hypothetical protein